MTATGKQARGGEFADVSREIAEALWQLLASGKPRFPAIAAEFALDRKSVV